MKIIEIIVIIVIIFAVCFMIYAIYDLFKDKSKVVTLKYIKLITDRDGFNHYEYIKQPNKNNWKAIVKELEDNKCMVKYSKFTEFIS